MLLYHFCFQYCFHIKYLLKTSLATGGVLVINLRYRTVNFQITLSHAIQVIGMDCAVSFCSYEWLLLIPILFLSKFFFPYLIYNKRNIYLRIKE
jgi:hypothetical protein